MLINLYDLIKNEIKKYPTVIICLFVIGGMYYKTTQDVNKLKESVQTFEETAHTYTISATIEFPLNIIEYGLKDISSENEIYKQIEVWHTDGWGAQIGALQTVCEVAPEKLHATMTAETQVNVCRLIK